MLKNEAKIYIIGAGPAGLTASYYLVQRGFHPIICEATDTLGGLAGSVDFVGKQYDLGPHIFLESCQEEAVDFWNEINGDDLYRLELNRGMVINGKAITFPPKKKEVLKVLGLKNTVKSGFSLLKQKIGSTHQLSSSADIFRMKYGDEFRKHLFDPFCQKYMGLSDTAVHADFAKSLTSFVEESDRKGVETDYKKLNTILYPLGGTKKVWNKVFQAIKSQVEMKFNHKLSAIGIKDGRVESLQFENGTEANPDYVISSLPVKILIEIIENSPESLRNEVNSLESMNTRLVYLKSERIGFAQQYVTVFDHSMEAGRITNFSNWSDFPSTNESIYCVEYWCSNKSSNWQISKDEITDKAIRELSKIGFMKSSTISAHKVIDIPRSHPVLSLKHSNTMQNVNEYLKSIKNLSISGRHATFKWDGQADNLVYGKNLANEIAEYLK